MNYVVIDLEWNQYHNPYRTPVSKSGVMMHEEIIQIGAIKTDHNMNPVDTYKTFIRLGGGRRLDRYVKKLTHITEDDIASGEDFDKAAPMFIKWLSDVDGIFSWGPDDRRVLMNNLAFHGIDAPVCKWYDAQKIFKSQVQQNGGMALKKVAEEYGLYVNLALHDALNDAILTSVCMGRLDMDKGVREYARVIPGSEADNGFPAPIAVYKTHRHRSQQAAWDEACANPLRCPECMRVLEWVGEERGSIEKWYKTACCPEHGDYMIRGEFLGQNMPYIRYAVYHADEGIAGLVERDLTVVVSKKRRRRRRKKPAAVQLPMGDALLIQAIARVTEGYRLSDSAIRLLKPMETAQIASTMTDDSAIVAACVLREAMPELKDITREDIEKAFGTRVALMAAPDGEEDDSLEEVMILRLSRALCDLRALNRDRMTIGEMTWTRPGALDKKTQAARHRAETDALSALSRFGAYQEYARLVDEVFGKPRRRKTAE